MIPNLKYIIHEPTDYNTPSTLFNKKQLKRTVKEQLAAATATAIPWGQHFQ